MQRGQHIDSLAVLGVVESAVVGGGIGILTGGATGYCFGRRAESLTFFFHMEYIRMCSCRAPKVSDFSHCMTDSKNNIRTNFASSAVRKSDVNVHTQCLL